MDLDDVPAKGGIIGVTVATLANGFKSKTIKGFDNPSEYRAQRSILKSPEYVAIKTVVKDKRLRNWCRLGIRLRSLQGQDEAVQKMKRNFLQMDGPDALFVAQAVQVGLLQKLMTLLQEQGYSATAQEEQVERFLRNITRHLLLVNIGDNVKDCVVRALTALRQNPIWYCIAGSGVAKATAYEVAMEVFPSATSHDLHPQDEPQKFTAFFRLLVPGEKATFVIPKAKKKAARRSR